MLLVLWQTFSAFLLLCVVFVGRKVYIRGMNKNVKVAEADVAVDRDALYAYAMVSGEHIMVCVRSGSSIVEEIAGWAGNADVSWTVEQVLSVWSGPSVYVPALVKIDATAFGDAGWDEERSRVVNAIVDGIPFVVDTGGLPEEIDREMLATMPGNGF